MNTRPVLINLQIENAYNRQIYLEEMSWEGGRNNKLDSVFIKDRIQTVTFTIPDQEENVFVIRTSDRRMNLRFINDAARINIYANFEDPSKTTVTGSSATSSLKNFIARMNAHTPGQSPFDIRGISQKGNDADQFLFRDYVDTVGSAAAALYVYQAVDFGSDYVGLSRFTHRLSDRFPGHSGIQLLRIETEKYLSIFREELKTGDTAPALSLPDVNGNMQSLNAYSGKYVFIDFWSSWCGRCNIYSKLKKDAFAEMDSSRFVAIGIAMDADTADWKGALKYYQYTGQQWVDQKVWRGDAAYAFKIDSIPFNFLIDPHGKIIAKAIPPDSLLIKFKQLVH
ncbi:MAG TPA: TlpA disulfide reductase family protein [Flavitalea sp.]|nr:TlpA disulfide reductase family protein [Flavitalea sp.]